jgi:protein FAM32A
MPPSEYAASSGALKLKGGSGITKHKKKKKPKPSTENSSQALEKSINQDEAVTASKEEPEVSQHDVQEESSKAPVAKTEAELRFEENRRKRLEEKLKKDGSKTHKERVEELNRYLSKLSEHHDM